MCRVSPAHKLFLKIQQEGESGLLLFPLNPSCLLIFALIFISLVFNCFLLLFIVLYCSHIFDFQYFTKIKQEAFQIQIRDVDYYQHQNDELISFTRLGCS